MFITTYYIYIYIDVNVEGNSWQEGEWVKLEGKCWEEKSTSSPSALERIMEAYVKYKLLQHTKVYTTNRYPIDTFKSLPITFVCAIHTDQSLPVLKLINMTKIHIS